MELGEHEIVFKPQTSIKAQALAGFITEITSYTEVSAGDEPHDNQKSTEVTHKNQWNLFSDASSCIKGTRVG